MDVMEVKKIESYMRTLFGNAKIRIVPRPKKDDSAEVYIGEEFIGVIFVDDEDDDKSYNFQMAILKPIWSRSVAMQLVDRHLISLPRAIGVLVGSPPA